MLTLDPSKRWRALGNTLYAGGFPNAGGISAINHRQLEREQLVFAGRGSIYFYLRRYVSALAVSGTLYAGGWFLTAAALSAKYLPNGTEQLVGARFGDQRTVSALRWSGSTLYAGGSFLRAGGFRPNTLPKWEWEQWSALGSGMNAR